MLQLVSWHPRAWLPGSRSKPARGDERAAGPASRPADGEGCACQLPARSPARPALVNGNIAQSLCLSTTTLHPSPTW